MVAVIAARRFVGRSAMVLSVLCFLPGQLMAATESRAVLVGVSEYPMLGERFRLRGTVNDVTMVAALLESRLGFQPTDVLRLTEESGKTHPELLPTRANILRELEALATRSKAGDRVFVLLAGHGSQQPAVRGSATESGGLDEIFLPRDVERWRDSAGAAGVPNAIIDDEFRSWLGRLGGTGATSWVVFDCCHSGDLARSTSDGAPGETERAIPPAALSIPASVGPAGAIGIGSTEHFENLVVTYACQPNEKTVERRYPDGAKGITCGLLTSMLTQALETVDEPVSYGHLLAEIHRLYRAEGRGRGPTPYSEGDVARTILATHRLDDRFVTVQRDSADGELTLNAGALHGITPGSILAVRRPLERIGGGSGGSQPLGHVEVVAVDARSSRIRTVAYDGSVSPDPTVLDGGLATVVVTGADIVPVRVACRASGPADPLEGIRSRLEAREEVRLAVTFVPPESGPDWMIRHVDDHIVLTPALPAVGAEHRIPAGIDSDEIVRSLADRLCRIGRAETVLRVASCCPAASGLGIVSEMLSDSGRYPTDAPLRLRAGDRFTLSITNGGQRPRDVTVLHVAADQMISALFPEPLRGETSRLECGDARSVRLRCDEHSAGREWIVILVVDAKGVPADFTSLADPKQAHRAVGTDWLSTMLDMGQAPTRGVSTPQSDGCAAQVITFDIASERLLNPGGKPQALQ
jgi:hypothetical protein